MKTLMITTCKTTTIRTIALCLLVSCSALGGTYASGKFEPPQGTTLVVIGQNQKSIDEYVRTFKRLPAGFMLYTDLAECTGLKDPIEYGNGVMHGQYLVDTYPGTVLQLGLYLVDMLDEALAGTYDDKIDLLGQWIAATRRPVFLRIGYEFDGPHNRYEPGKYVQVYRRIVDRLRANHVDNVAFVWHSYAAYPVYQSRKQADYYPGDTYVDWFAVSFFNNSASSVPMTAMVTMAKEHGKPLMIAESTPAGIGVLDEKQAYFKWFKPLFSFIEKNDVKMLCYINDDWDAEPMFVDFKWKDARVQSNPAVTKFWLEETSKPRYRRYSDDLYGLLGYK
jgi:hypothetical protein